MELSQYSTIVTVLISPLLTALAAVIGWVIIIRDSRSSAHRTEATELLNLIVTTTVELNRRAAKFLLSPSENRQNHRAWVSSVSVDMASLRARAAILKDVYDIEVADEYFYKIRQSFTRFAEEFHEYDSDRVSQKIEMQNAQVSRTLKSLYNIYPIKKSLGASVKEFFGFKPAKPSRKLAQSPASVVKPPESASPAPN